MDYTASTIPIEAHFGRLVIISGPERTSYVSPNGRVTMRYRYHAICTCPEHTVVTVRGDHLLAGSTSSCGCLRRELSASASRRLANPLRAQLRGRWREMIARCENPRFSEYDYYGGKGITVCEAWHDFEQYYQWAIASGFLADKKFKLRRKNKRAGYTPDNCEWAIWRTPKKSRSKRRQVETTV